MSPDEVAGLPLLQQTTRPYAWRQWFASAGVRAANDMGGMRLELFSMLAQAAIERMGVALIPPFLIQQELTAGRLISPCLRSFPSTRAYYLIVPERPAGKAERPALTRFREWLVAPRADAHFPRFRPLSL
jgi:DNA-binding transcriptional LysR family regulator